MSENYFCNFIGTTFTYLWTWLIIRIFFHFEFKCVQIRIFLSSRSSLQMMIIIWHFRFVATHKSLLKILSIGESIDLWQFVKRGSRKKYHSSRAPTNSFSWYGLCLIVNCINQMHVRISLSLRLNAYSTRKTITAHFDWYWWIIAKSQIVDCVKIFSCPTKTCQIVVFTF